MPNCVKLKIIAYIQKVV